MITFEFLDINLVKEATEKLRNLDISKEVEENWCMSFMIEDKDFIYDFDCEYGEVVAVRIKENI